MKINEISIDWVDDYGVIIGIAKFEEGKRLLFKDESDNWRFIGYADAQHEEYHSHLRATNRSYGNLKLNIRNLNEFKTP